uniref:Endonuclease/exonuclease/phosphatase domain-containing protein n=1 Tax=Astyanax mexicanus TaxID=7994 RepID=A0A3B1JZH1_ASTMX
RALSSIGANFTVLTINVRGLRNAVKRAAVFQDLASISPTICCLQEVHLRDQRDEALFSQQWVRGRAYWSVGGVHSSGVGILLGDRTFEKVTEKLKRVRDL